MTSSQPCSYSSYDFIGYKVARCNYTGVSPTTPANSNDQNENLLYHHLVGILNDELLSRYGNFQVFGQLNGEFLDFALLRQHGTQAKQ